MPSLLFFSQVYDLLARRRKLLFTAVAAVLGGSLLALGGLRLEENIAAMLPDGRSEVARDFALLEQAPFARKILITLTAEPEGDREELLEAADALRQALTPPTFSKVVSGPSDLNQGRLFGWLAPALPNLLNAEELKAWGEGMDGQAVDSQLQELYTRLLLPEGWALKGLLRVDPLGLHRLGLAKLQHLNLVPQARLEENHFLSADGRHALIIADTPVPITDSTGAEEIKVKLQAAMAASLPPTISASVVSGHAYTAANAGAVKRDLVITLSASLLAMAAIFLIFLRHGRAFFVFIIPVSVVGLAAAAVSLFHHTVSAVTIGFGAVLLGISVDFALHVYFALRRGGAAPGKILAAVARPVLFGGITSMAAFAVLLFSDLPGQRQLAVFAMTGLAASLLLSLLVLPQLIPAGPPIPPSAAGPSRRWRPARGAVLTIWIAVLLLAAWQAPSVRFNGDLRSLSLVPEELRAAEGDLRTTWGDVRGKAMIFAEGDSLESALAANDRLFAFLQQHLSAGEAVSLAPVLPSAAVQEANRRSWEAFWQGEAGERIQVDLQRKGEQLGFAEDAFAPFLAGVRAPGELTDPAALRQAGLGEVVEAMILNAGSGYRLLSLAPDTPEMVALFQGAKEELPGVRLVSQVRFGQELSQAISRDFIRFISAASVVVVLLLTLLFRDARKILLALVPVVTGLLVLFGAMGAIGLDFTLLNVMATILVIGLGVDYGIFMVCRMTEDYDHATGRAVFVSGLTTIAGFGALVLARHPALHSIGITVLLGIGAAIPAALLVIPALYRGRS
jgi:uncharacterized protein